MNDKIFLTQLAGLKFTAGSYFNVVKTISKRLLFNPNFILLPCSLNDLASIQQTPSLKKIYNQVDIATTDGMPLVWFLTHKLKKLKKNSTCSIERVYGPTLMKTILYLTRDKHFKHCFYGSSPQTLLKLKRVLTKISPNFQKAIFISPPYRDLDAAETKQLISFLKKNKVNMMWLGISSPKQVKLATQLKKHLPNTSFFCIGAGFDFLSLKKPMAPKIMQKLGLEWLFRLLYEPKRLSKRYLITIPKYLWSLLK